MKLATNHQTRWPTTTQSILRLSRYLCFIVGILALGYAAFMLLDARLYQANESRRFEQARQAGKSAMPYGGGKSTNPPLPLRLSQQNHAANQGRETVRRSPAWGRIEINSIGLSSMLLEGGDQETLQRGIGHIPGTAFPSQKGNVVLAGHRDTFFRALRNISKDDEIVLETLDGSYRYRVDLTQVVGPEDTEVLNGSDDAILTLVTCYPFSFVGPAPQRFIVRARRIPE